MNKYFVRYSYEYTTINKQDKLEYEVLTESIIILLDTSPTDIYTVQAKVYRDQLSTLKFPPAESEINILVLNKL